MTPNTLMNQSGLGVLADRPPVKSQETMTFESAMQHKLISRLQSSKSALMRMIEHLEKLLLLSDQWQSQERHDLVSEMRWHERQIALNERNIRNLLAEIAVSEMKRNLVADELEENTLKTIEVINISDIKIERENLERQNIELEKKQQEVEKVENELLREKEKVDERKRRRRNIINNPRNTTSN